MHDINISIVKSSVVKGLLSTIILLLIYFSVVTFVSGWAFAQGQFREFWYFVVALAMGFGIQVGLYSSLKNAIKQNTSPRVLAVSGTTSTAAMISCCTHYLVNLLPIIGTAGIITFISSYQVQFFWVGLMSNFIGVLYMLNKVIKLT